VHTGFPSAYKMNANPALEESLLSKVIHPRTGGKGKRQYGGRKSVGKGRKGAAIFLELISTTHPQRERGGVFSSDSDTVRGLTNR